MAQRRFFRQIIIRYITIPSEEDYDVELDWIFQCLGLGDDSNDIAKAIFRQLVKASKEHHGVSSRELMEKFNVTQAAIVYHLNTFMRSGLIIKDGRLYHLRGGTLNHAIEEIESDMVRRFALLKEIAKKIEEGS